MKFSSPWAVDPSYGNEERMIDLPTFASWSRPEYS